MLKKCCKPLCATLSPSFFSGSGGGLGTGGLALAYQCQQSGRVRACVESVLVLSLMNKLRTLLEAEHLLSAFTKVRVLCYTVHLLTIEGLSFFKAGLR